VIFHFGLRFSGLIHLRLLFSQVRDPQGSSSSSIFATEPSTTLDNNSATQHVSPAMPTKRSKGSGSSVISEHTLNPLQFVTIMNPNDIKDPIKQKAIRQHARRRELVLKSSSRMPFKLIFDLAGVDIQTDAEQSIIKSYDWLSAEREYLKLAPFVPSLQFMRPISIGHSSLFTISYSLDVNAWVLQLVDFSKYISDFPISAASLNLTPDIEGKTSADTSKVRQGGDKKFCPLMDFWWNMVQLDSTAFFFSLAYASRLLNQRHPIEPKQCSEAIKLYTTSIQCLQKRLQMSVEGTSDGIIITILEFAYYDVRCSHLLNK
jgi:hypothetical protein